MKADGKTPMECHILTELADMLRAVANKIDVNNEEVETATHQFEAEVARWVEFSELKLAWEVQQKKESVKNLLKNL